VRTRGQVLGAAVSARPDVMETALAAVLRRLGHRGEPPNADAEASAREVAEVVLGTVPRQPHRRGYTFLELPFQPRISRNGRLFRVKYGEEVRSGLSYVEATRVLGKVLMHSLTCDGRLD